MTADNAATSIARQTGEDVSAIWSSIQERLRAELGQRTYDSWVKPIQFVRVSSPDVVLSLPTHFMCDWIKSHFAERLRGLWASRVPGVTTLRLVVAPAMNSQSAPTPEPLAVADTPAADLDFGGRLEERHTFERFVIGPSNECAYNAALRLAQGGPVNFNPLFLHSGVGMGKTHLMHAIGWEVRRRDPAAKVVYITAEKFMLQFMAALRHQDTIAFKERFRSVDMLLIDDIQFFAGKESTQSEFFHTINTLIGDGRKLVISADRSIYDIEGIEERVRSRLQWGLVAAINPADYELRLNILQARVEQATDVSVPRDVVEFLARRITSNVRELEGALNRIVGHALLLGKPIDLAFARQVLSDVLRAFDRRLTIDEIQRRVAEFYNLKLSELMSDRRAREVARPRQVAMYLSKQLTQRSLPEIGRRFGGRDHTTVMHAVKRITDLKAADSELAADIDRLTRLLDA